MPNDILSKGRIILQGQVLGPESFAVDSKGGWGSRGGCGVRQEVCVCVCVCVCECMTVMCVCVCVCVLWVGGGACVGGWVCECGCGCVQQLL